MSASSSLGLASSAGLAVEVALVVSKVESSWSLSGCGTSFTVMKASASFAELDKISAAKNGYLLVLEPLRLLVCLILAAYIFRETRSVVNQFSEVLWLREELNQLGI